MRGRRVYATGLTMDWDAREPEATDDDTDIAPAITAVGPIAPVAPVGPASPAKAVGAVASRSTRVSTRQ